MCSSALIISCLMNCWVESLSACFTVLLSSLNEVIFMLLRCLNEAMCKITLDFYSINQKLNPEMIV
ncbi:hypothetical protein T10_10206 [Trichinella papuae]|uniref:Uncharacterized protein n=1 Tax=Trichinella papuae TaxID=268474 RepID=A0A0V1N0V3_9BILA|nr:hypothetical protein T10_10206 [Trichinella papuae]